MSEVASLAGRVVEAGELVGDAVGLALLLAVGTLSTALLGVAAATVVAGPVCRTSNVGKGSGVTESLLLSSQAVRTTRSRVKLRRSFFMANSPQEDVLPNLLEDCFS
ncbi:hypothetical protein D3C76_1076300 [compost metagenome]